MDENYIVSSNDYVCAIDRVATIQDSIREPKYILDKYSYGSVITSQGIDEVWIDPESGWELTDDCYFTQFPRDDELSNPNYNKDIESIGSQFLGREGCGDDFGSYFLEDYYLAKTTLYHAKYLSYGDELRDKYFCNKEGSLVSDYFSDWKGGQFNNRHDLDGDSLGEW